MVLGMSYTMMIGMKLLMLYPSMLQVYNCYIKAKVGSDF